MNCINCKSELKEGAKFCGKCGTQQQSVEVLTVQNETQNNTSVPSTNIQNSNSLGKIKDRIFWNIQSGEIARRFNEAQMADCDSAKGIVINEGTTAFIKANGELIAEIHGGAYDFVEPEKLKKVLDKREGGVVSGIKSGLTFLSNLILGEKVKDKVTKNDTSIDPKKENTISTVIEGMKKNKLFSITLKLDKSFILPISFEGEHAIKTKVLDTNIGFEAYFKIDNFQKFSEHYLGHKDNVTYSDLSKEIRPLIKSSIQSILQDIDLNSSILTEELVEKIKNKIALDTSNSFFGIVIEKIITISSSNEALDRIRKKEGELAISEKELDLLVRTQEFRNRLTNQTNSQALIEARTEKDQAFELGKINNDGLLQEDELEKFRMVLSREKRIREASNEEEIREALIDIEKTGLLKDEDLENLKRSIKERGEDHDISRFHSVELMQLNNTLEIDRKNLEWEYEIGDKRIQLEIDRRRKSLQAEIGYTELEIEQWKKIDDYEDSKFYQELSRNRTAAEAEIDLKAKARESEIDLDNKEMDAQLERMRKVKEMEMAQQKLEHEQAIQAEKQRLDQEINLKEIDIKMAETYKGMSFEQIMAANPNISPDAAAALAKKFEADAAASANNTAAADAKENQAKMEAFMQKQMEMQMQMMNKMMDTSATMSGNLLQTQQQQTSKMEERLERTEQRLDNTQDKSLDYTTKNNSIDAIVSNNNQNQAPAPGYIKCMGCKTVENTIGTKYCFNCGREL
jgi:hypothetical protein